MPSMFKSVALALAATAFSRVSAQTFSLCDPTKNATCPPDPALGTQYLWNWTTTGAPDMEIWNTTGGSPDYQDTKGAQFTIQRKGESPTIQSNFFIFFGQVSCIMKAAPGRGIVSSIVLESDDLDEIDWEWVGGNTTHVETNYFGKGNTTSYDRAIWHPADDFQNKEHNYTIRWTAETLDWILDNKTIRTLHYNDALNGYNYPQTPMRVKIGIWVAGDLSSNSQGTVDWAGGLTDYAAGPYTMTVSSLYVQDFSSGKSYSYSDNSGSYQSIAIEAGNSTIADRLNKIHGVRNRVKNHYNHLPTWAKYAIAAGSLGVAALALLVFTICCIKSRRAGRKERAIADAAWQKEMAEMGVYKEEFRAKRGSRLHFW